MQLVRRLADRFLPPLYEHPDPPVEAAAFYPSMIFSADDEARPSERLLNLSLKAVQRTMAEVALDDIAARPRAPAYFNNWPGEHYRLLGGLVLAMKPRVIVEIGTGAGLATLAMKKYLPPDGWLITFDLQRWDLFADTLLTVDDFSDLRLSQEVGDLAAPATIQQHRKLLESADFVLINGPRDSQTEQALLDSFSSLQFQHRPILLFDEIRPWSVLQFWRQVPYPKLDLTSFGHWSGTGLVEMP